MTKFALSGRTALTTVALGLPITLSMSGAAMAEANTTNWATWTLPAEYPLTGTEPGIYFAPGAAGSVVDPITGNTINLTLSGEVYQASSTDFDWSEWGSPAYESEVSPTAPDGGEEINSGEIITATGATEPQYLAHTLEFGTDVTNAVLGIYSLGRPGIEGQLTFSQPFVVLSGNEDLTAGGDAETGYTLTGQEGNGVIQFLGTYDSISWTITGVEVWHGVNVGLTTVENESAGETVAVYDLFGDGTGNVAPTPFDPNPDDSEPEPDPVPEEPQLSVLERVLVQVDEGTNLAKLNGTFVNIAENLGGPAGAGIDGSITNVVMGLTQHTQRVVADASTEAIEFEVPSLAFGDMGTTALGAVNTGEIALGVSSAVDQAKTRRTYAVSSAVDQLGGSADTGVLVLNIASNMTGIDGSIANTMYSVNSTVGALSTTALGAVNTGKITSGVDAVVNGIVSIDG